MTNVCVVNYRLVCVVAGLTRNLRRFLFASLPNIALTPSLPTVFPTPSFPSVPIGNPLFPQSASFFNSLCRLFSFLSVFIGLYRKSAFSRQSLSFNRLAVKLGFPTKTLGNDGKRQNCSVI
jgi:hypothetical protein